jgi:hypothetical protein
MITGSQHVTAAELSLPPLAMLPARAQQETMTEGEWAGMPEELFEKVLELLQAAGQSEPQEGGFGFSQTTATVRLVCAGWKAVHDAMVKRLVLRDQTSSDTPMPLRRFPAVRELSLPAHSLAAHQAELQKLSALTSLDLDCDDYLTAADGQALRSLATLTTLRVHIDDDGEPVEESTTELIRALEGLPALTSLSHGETTDSLVEALSGRTAITALSLLGHVSDTAVRRICSSFPALASLTLASDTATATALVGLRNLTTLTSLTLHLGDETLEDYDENPLAPQVTDEVMRSLACLVHLTHLHVDDCWSPATNVGMQELGALTRLTYLSIRLWNTVSDEGLWTLRNLTGLSSLRLYGQMIQGTAARAWSSLTGLTSLELWWGLTDEGARAVSTLSSLTSLHLVACGVTRRGRSVKVVTESWKG